jgi:uncharacterized integral membrane protein (TIGR00698 family)
MKLSIGILLAVFAIWSGSAVASIFTGIIYSLILNLPDNFITKSAGPRLLQTGIVILGLSISLTKAFSVTGSYLPSISLLVIITFFLGIYIGKLIGLDKKLTLLIASGAAICGGTAMVAIAPIIKARPKDLLTAITLIFLLNALAIIIFPIIGLYLGLSQDQFGAWAAMAIHDTSSVIGAAMVYGEEAVETAATLKLGRTLWLIPLILLLSYKYQDKSSTKFQLPFFVIFFIIAIAIGSFIDLNSETLSFIKLISQSFLLLGLFCIGSQIDKKVLSNISVKPLQLVLILWIIVIPSSYLLIQAII